MARIIMVKACQHGNGLPHGGTRPGYCNGGKTVASLDLDRLPSRSIEAAAKRAHDFNYKGKDGWDSCTDDCKETFLKEAEAAIRAFLSDLEQGDQE